jgi:hypothetical protein
MSQFRSSALAVKWSELHKQRQELIEGKQTSKIEDKIDLISSLMSSCKTGFMLPEAKIKKTIKFLKEHTGRARIRYGVIPDGTKPNTILFKNIVVLYVEQGEQIIFREHISEK